MRSQTARRRRSLSFALTAGFGFRSGGWCYVCRRDRPRTRWHRRGTGLRADRRYSRSRREIGDHPVHVETDAQRHLSELTAIVRDSVERRELLPRRTEQSAGNGARRGDRFRFVTVVTPTGRGGRPVHGNRTDHGEKRRVAGHLQTEFTCLLKRDRDQDATAPARSHIEVSRRVPRIAPRHRERRRTGQTIAGTDEQAAFRRVELQVVIVCLCEEIRHLMVLIGRAPPPNTCSARCGHRKLARDAPSTQAPLYGC